MFRLQIIILLLFVVKFSFSQQINSQYFTVKIRFKLKADTLLKHPLSMSIASSEDKSHTIFEKIIGNGIDTVLRCKIPYVIRFQSEGVYSESLKFYSKSCNDTTINISFNPINVITHERDSSGVIIEKK